MPRRLKKSISGFVVVLCLLGSSVSGSAEDGVYTITIKDHRFSPAELVIPAGKKVKIMVENQDLTPEEFESYDLKREKVVGVNGEITLFIGPLKAGVYKYFGDFHPQTAQGSIVVKERG